MTVKGPVLLMKPSSWPSFTELLLDGLLIVGMLLSVCSPRISDRWNSCRQGRVVFLDWRVGV